MKNKTKRQASLRLLQKAVSVLLAFTLIFLLAESGAVKVQAAKSTKNAGKRKTLILYFSATGTTKGAAKKIKKATKGTLIEIKPAAPYTEDDLDYGNDDSRVVAEHNTADSPAKSTLRPEVKNMTAIKKAVKKADTIFIGYPVWWQEAPHIVYNVVENVNLKGKTVIPFCTSASSGLGKSDKHLKENADISPKTVWKKGKNFYDIPSRKTVNKWIKSVMTP